MRRLQSILKSGMCIFLLTLFVGCAAAQKNTSDASRAEDLVITKKVSTALFTAPGLRTAQINVATTNGVVKLTGVVERSRDIETAREIAAGVPGVVQVQDVLSVKQ